MTQGKSLEDVVRISILRLVAIKSLEDTKCAP